MTGQNRPELLAPAGDWEAMRAAVANGADAVYFGLSAFNARYRATNFEVQELPQIMGFLHDHNVRGFVTLNTLIFSNELPAIADYLQAIAAAGVDAVIVQDLGLARLIRNMIPALHIHASTQMTLTEPRGIAFVQKHLGIDRVVLARELSLAEIRKVATAVPMPLEVFIHGALCVAYSGQCLTSEALGGRSANRGQCAQACRLPYEMIVDGKPKDLGDRAYLLSPQDLAAYDWIDDLTAAGVISFKIEGRLKTAHYVAATTQTYRAAIDAAIQKRPFEMSRPQERDLAMTFSRGFTPGFLDGVQHQKLVQGRFPKSRGVRVGTVQSVTRRGVRIRLTENDPNLLKAGDGVVFDLGRPAETEPGGRIWTVQIDGMQAELVFEADALDFSDVKPGTLVWKTDDPALRKRLEKSFATDEIVHRQPVDLVVRGSIGSPLEIVGSIGSQSATVHWPGPLVLAQKHPLTPESFRAQFDRFGDTPFLLGQIDFQLTDAVMVPKSVLNDLRRQLVPLLLEHRGQVWNHEIIRPEALTELRERIKPTSPANPAETGRATLAVLVRNLDQLRAVVEMKSAAKPAWVYCDFEDTRRYREAVPIAKDSGVPIALATLRIIKPGEEGFLKPILNTEPDAVLVRNLTSLSFFQEQAPGLSLLGDFSLNVANELSAHLLMEQGFRHLVPSYDLNWDQLKAMVQQADPNWFEVVIHQHMPMFHMEHCVFAAFLSNGNDFRDCGRPCDHHKIELRDRVGSHFPVTPDVGCRNTVYNSVAQSAAEYVSAMRSLGLRKFRIDLLRETAEQISPLLDRYHRVLSGDDDGKTIWKQLQLLNQLGVTRGTLQMV